MIKTVNPITHGSSGNLKDRYNRVARKLRISVTDKCNMKCIYCMPNDNIKWNELKEILNFKEIIRIVSILARLGITKIRITGGEPLLRPSLEYLISDLIKIENIESISMTTNGFLLEEKINRLKSAGLNSLNISLDTFKEERFRTLNGISNLNKVLRGIQKARELGLKIKINTVIIKNWNDDEIANFVNFARDMDLTVRFIEFMPLDGTGIWNYDLVMTKNEIIKIIKTKFHNSFSLDKNNSNNLHRSDPAATIYNFDDRKGKIGFISSITDPFCTNCDRIRLTSNGRLLTCLFEKEGYDIKKMIRNPKITDQEIREYIINSYKMKPEGIVELIRINRLRPSLNLMHKIGG
ncbi:MAG TPA: GTP 3',8-cyclase MoaA [Nitrososphaeraceae archaeon]|nr:GTP 3',8-cyclase MoaA [Nitrososphaeraceae archaeon]